MKKSKFSDCQIMQALKRVEAGLNVPDLCHEIGIRTATFYKWLTKFGGMDTSLMSRMKELEEENRQHQEDVRRRKTQDRNCRCELHPLP